MKHLALESSYFAAALIAATAAAGAAATPEISGVTIAQDGMSRAVTVNYTLSGENAIVTLDVLTNGVSIGAANVWAVEGDVNKLVGPGSRSITWHPDKSWPDQKFGEGVVSARVTAWNENDPPPYLAANLLVQGDVKYYTCAEAVPGGVGDVLYKTTSILMRRIYARGKAFSMGSPANEPGRWTGDAREAQHEFSFGNDYYVGVYELTRQQYDQITGGGLAAGAKTGDWPTLPVDSVTYASLRSNKFNVNAAQSQYYYPNAPFGTSLLGLLRTQTGLAFDLPGAAQWEYAAKAGNGDYKWGDGSLIVSTLDSDEIDDVDPALDALGRYSNNGSSVAPVGSYAPNSWGLYDMHGNLIELLNDPYDVTNGYSDVPKGATGQRAAKGGSFAAGAFRCRAAYQFSRAVTGTDTTYANTGCRLAITLP